MANLLQKASIVLTPKAYDNGKVLCAKPSKAPYGDFDFSRNSAATRVNAQGLVENVQILSSNLVQNGDFSEEGVQEISNGSFSQIGPEEVTNGNFSQIGPEEVSNGSFSQEGVQLVTNGSFDTDSDWTKQTGWSISGGSANCDGTQTSNTNLTQTNIINDQSKTYKVEFTLSNYVSGSVKSKISNDAQGVSRTANGTYVDYLSGMTNTQLNFTANSDFIGSIDNVSVREVGQDWDFVGEAELTEQGARILSTSGGQSYIKQNALTNTKSYKISYDIVDSTQGAIKLINVNGVSDYSIPSTIGSHTVYFTANNNILFIYRSGVTDITITNISVKEVGMDWTLVSADTSIGDNKLVCDNVLANTTIATQIGTVPTQKSVILKYDVIVNSGAFRILLGSGGTSTIVTTSGTYTFYETSGTGNSLNLQARSGGFDGSVTNISVKEIPDWNLGTGWSIGEDKAVADGSDTSVSGWLRQNNILTPGKTYTFSCSVETSDSGPVGTVNDLYTTALDIDNGSGEYTTTFTAVGSGLAISQKAGKSFSITNISVKEVGMDWVLNDWSIGDSLVSSGNTSSFLYQANVFTSTTNTYKSTFRARSVSGASVTLRLYDGVSSYETFTITSSDFQDFELTRQRNGANATLYFYNDLNAEIEITNISVIEITDDTNLPRINYENFSYQDALGSEEIVNGSFDSDTAWVKGTGWSISGGTANCDGTQLSNSNLLQSNVVTSGSTYKITYTISNFVSGTLKSVLGVGGVVRNSNGVYSEYITATSSTFLLQANLDFIGSIDNVSVKEYSGQIPIPNSGCGSWLFEPQSTNLITQSETFSDWHKLGGRSQITINNAISPDGTQNASKLEQILATGDASIRFTGLTAGVKYTFSLYAKKGNHDNIGLDISDIYTVFTLTDNWVRYEITETATSNFVDVGLRSGVVGSYFYIWGAQVEALPYATSYIPTSGSTVTRNQDVCNSLNIPSLLGQTEGAFFIEINKSVATAEIFSFNRSTSNSFQVFTDSINYKVLSYYEGGSHNRTTSIPFTDTIKMAVSYKNNELKLYANGTEFYSSNVFTWTPNVALANLYFNKGGYVAGNKKSEIKALAIWKEALSDEELVELTYPTPTDPTFSLDFDTIAEQFTFARGSEATYVDAQGLIQSTNEIGEELITNGDFSNGSTRWSLTNFSIINEKAVIDSSSPGYLIQTSVTEIGKTYRVEFTVSDYVEGRLRLRTPFINNDLESNPENGTYVYYGVADDTSFQIQSRFNGEDYKYKIDNVSVKEVTTATNTPRLDYSTGAEAFLLEPQSTNLITQSELFSDASWLRVGSITTTDNYTTSPSGQNNATRLQWTNATNYIYQSLSHVGNDFTSSIYLKSNTDVSQSVRLFMDNGAQAQDVLVTTQWQRFEFTNTTTPTQSNRNVGLIKSYGQVGDLDISIWGAQFEALSYPTSLIPTSGSTVTRNQETCINATPEINSEEGVLYAEIAKRQEDNDNFILISLTNAASNSDADSVTIGFNNSTHFYFRVKANGSLSFIEQSITSNKNQFYKVALKYKSGNISAFIDGVNVASNTTAFSFGVLLDNLSFDYNGNGTLPFYGNTKDVQVYTKALSDAELIKLTT